MEIIQGSLGSNKVPLYHCGVIDISRPHPARFSCPASGMSPNGQFGGRKSVCLDPSHLHVITSLELSCCVTPNLQQLIAKKKKRKEKCFMPHGI